MCFSHPHIGPHVAETAPKPTRLEAIRASLRLLWTWAGSYSAGTVPKKHPATTANLSQNHHTIAPQPRHRTSSQSHHPTTVAPNPRTIPQLLPNHATQPPNLEMRYARKGSQ